MSAITIRKLLKNKNKDQKNIKKTYREAKKLQEEYYKDINNKDIKRIALSD